MVEAATGVESDAHEYRKVTHPAAAMESFVLAETLKYFYLLFVPLAMLDPQQVVLTRSSSQRL